MKVLLVDDDQDIRRIAQLGLTAVGRFEVVVAASAEQGIAAAKAELPDVILMDVMMPGLDGLGALARLRQDEQVSRIPVIFMTAKVQRSEVDAYRRAGAAGVIQKPFDPMTLSKVLLKVLERRNGP